MTSRLLLSVVVPVYEEEGVLELFHDRLVGTLDRLDHAWEIIYVDDGSSDGSYRTLVGLASGHAGVRVIRLSRNFGHQLALTAGLDAAAGDAVITLDSDLQMPPEAIPDFVDAWEDGAKIVNGRRSDSEDLGPLKRITSRAFYRIVNRLSDVRIEPNAPDFRLLDRDAVSELRRMRESDRFLRGMIATLGFPSATVDFQAEVRSTGRSKYTLRKMLALAFDGIVSFSVVPLRIAIVGGMLSALLGAVYGLYAVVVRFTSDAVMPGWTSLIVINLFLGGAILLSLGVIGEYVGRIYRQVKRRPLYVVQEAVGFAESARDGDPGRTAPDVERRGSSASR